MSDALFLVVNVWVATDRIEEFEAFERRAAELIARFGGKIERVIRIPAASSDAATPFEVHVVTFPDSTSFDQYGADPEVRAFAPARERVIRRTVIWTGNDRVPY